MNKIKNKLYVALTRSLKDITLLITKEVEKPVEAVIEDTVYTAEIGLKVYMYDRDFDLKSRTD